MGIDVHGLNFLRYARLFGSFGDTLTIGRQWLHVIEPVIRDMMNLPDGYRKSEYCEDILLYKFGAKKVGSIDNSDYENATHVIDMNQELPSGFQKYKTIIDMGSLEHIFNVPQALMNISSLCEPGGQILHVLPANNFCGHGFWQFSPELFFSLYSDKNGYQDTDVFVADLTNTNRWYKVIKPDNGKRVNIISDTEVYVLCRTVLKGTAFSHDNVQQSDYVHIWAKNDEEPELTSPSILKKYLKRSNFTYALANSLYGCVVRARARSVNRLSRHNPSLIQVDVKSITTK